MTPSLSLQSSNRSDVGKVNAKDGRRSQLNFDLHIVK